MQADYSWYLYAVKRLHEAKCRLGASLKTESLKILKGLRMATNRNTNYCKKELEIIRRSQEKLENSFPETKAELKATSSRINNTEER